MLLLYFMDGLKFEMAEKYMPYLSSLNMRPLKSDFGYSCACHATMYTGRNIDEHNTWFVWKKGENSPYWFVDKVPFLKYLNCIPVKVLVSKVARKINRNTSFSGIPMLVNLPLKYWSLLNPVKIPFGRLMVICQNLKRCLKFCERKKCRIKLSDFPKMVMCLLKKKV